MKKIIVLILVVLGLPFRTMAQESTSSSLDVRIAPGELLPVSVKLVNFGNSKRVDVNITYTIDSEDGHQIYETSDTVAVDTTNNFVKPIQIPFDTAPGVYAEKTSIVYPGQAAPANSGFKFRVEKKILGLFQEQFWLYGVVTFILGFATVLVVYFLAKRRDHSRFSRIDYSNIPKGERTFYELISDTIVDMRRKVGDRALDVATSIDGLTIDENTGKIIKLTRSPSKIIAELVSGYEKILGEKISFSFRKGGDEHDK